GTECCRIKIDQRLLVEVDDAGRDHDGVEDGGILPGRSTHGESSDAGRLELVEQRDEFIPVLRGFAAGLVVKRLVQPYPVGGMDIDRRGNPLACVFGERLQGGWDSLV